MSSDFDALFASRPVLLAPMEDVSDSVFRRVCRARGAGLCVTEFALAERLIAGEEEALRKIRLAPNDAPTAIQIYGANPTALAQAAEIAERAAPAYLDVNCGCWVPKVARGGAGAGWLRDPDAMVAMARMVVERVALPVTVKTRIGWGDEVDMPIVDIARRLEDVGVRAITVHCRTAKMGHQGAADWRWATRVREAVSMPVIVNGDVRTANDAQRALEQTGCAGVMIGRRAIEHPWVFREVQARLAHAPKPAAPSWDERIELCREHLTLLLEDRGERKGYRMRMRALGPYLRKWPPVLIELQQCTSSAEVFQVLDEVQERPPETSVTTVAASEIDKTDAVQSA